MLNAFFLLVAICWSIEFPFLMSPVEDDYFCTKAGVSFRDHFTERNLNDSRCIQNTTESSCLLCYHRMIILTFVNTS